MSSLRIDNLTFGYRGVPPLLNGLSATVNLPEGGGHIAALVGRSGCGKTTLLKLIAGIERPLSGVLTLEPAGATISYLPQDSSLLEHLSPRDAVYLFEKLSATRHLVNRDLVGQIIDELEVRRVIEGAVPHSALSGGEKRRLALARALSINPRLLLLDEPCSGLDWERKASFLKLLRQAVDRHKVIAIYVTHHADEVDLVADSIIYMTASDGRVSDLLHVAAGAFREHPPSLEAAQFVLGHDYSALPCTITGAHIFGAGRVLLASAEASIGLEGEAIVMFPASSVAQKRGGLPVRVVGRSSRYVILQDTEGASFFGTGVSEVTEAEIALCGPVLVFNNSETKARRVTCV